MPLPTRRRSRGTATCEVWDHGFHPYPMGLKVHAIFPVEPNARHKKLSHHLTRLSSEPFSDRHATAQCDPLYEYVGRPSCIDARQRENQVAALTVAPIFPNESPGLCKKRFTTSVRYCSGFGVSNFERIVLGQVAVLCDILNGQGLALTPHLDVASCFASLPPQLWRSAGQQ